MRTSRSATRPIGAISWHDHPLATSSWEIGVVLCTQQVVGGFSADNEPLMSFAALEVLQVIGVYVRLYPYGRVRAEPVTCNGGTELHAAVRADEGRGHQFALAGGDDVDEGLELAGTQVRVSLFGFRASAV